MWSRLHFLSCYALRATDSPKTENANISKPLFASPFISLATLVPDLHHRPQDVDPPPISCGSPTPRLRRRPRLCLVRARGHGRVRRALIFLIQKPLKSFTRDLAAAIGGAPSSPPSTFLSRPHPATRARALPPHAIPRSAANACPVMGCVAPYAPRAAVVRETGPSSVMKVEHDYPVPKLAPGGVLVHNKYSGINFIDTYHRSGLYKRELPFIGGQEGGGFVAAVTPEAEAQGVKVNKL